MKTSQDTAKAFQNFLTTTLESRLDRHLTANPQDGVVKLFQSVTTDVPAYRKFLVAQGINPSGINTYADFQSLPLTTKQNYMLAYPIPMLTRGGALQACEMVAVSSGSTGKPLFWPRSLIHELDIATRFEHVFRDSFQAHTRSTLVVICFALGNWVGGLYTTFCCRYLAQKAYPLTLVTPGNNKAEIFRVIEELGGHFDQVVLAGYPPFLKDVIDTGKSQGIEWRRYQVKLILAGEVFTEEWRSLICERLGADNVCYQTASLYGTADAGVLGNETPISIAIRRFFATRPDAARAVFGESRLPTLVQYDPLSRFFETHDGTLVVSGDNGIPLVRYHIADRGGVYGYDEMLALVKEWGGDPLAQLNHNDGGAARPLPFVYLFGRADFTVSYFGANIYPENVSVGLEQPAIREWVSGKFVLQVKETGDRDRLLSIVVELAPGIVGNDEMASITANAIQRELLRLNSEFANYVPRQYQMPHVSFAPAGDTEYFPIGVKHRYTRRDA